MKSRLGSLAAAGVIAASVAAAPVTASASSETAPMAAREKALHVLSRLAFGPRPGDVDSVMEMGVAAYIEQQLAPERIPDPAVAQMLKDLPTLRMSQAELLDTFERPIQEARRRMRQQLARRDAASAEESGTAETEMQKSRASIPPEQRPRRVIEELSSARVLRAAYSRRQLNEVLVDFWMNHFNVYANKGMDRMQVSDYDSPLLATTAVSRPRRHISNRLYVVLQAIRRAPPLQRGGRSIRTTSEFSR
ncbi:MAG: DUF1800 family protein [Thermoanaerobaculia bacterium]